MYVCIFQQELEHMNSRMQHPGAGQCHSSTLCWLMHKYAVFHFQLGQRTFYCSLNSIHNSIIPTAWVNIRATFRQYGLKNAPILISKGPFPTFFTFSLDKLPHTFTNTTQLIIHRRALHTSHINMQNPIYSLSASVYNHVVSMYCVVMYKLSCFVLSFSLMSPFHYTNKKRQKQKSQSPLINFTEATVCLSVQKKKKHTILATMQCHPGMHYIGQ